MRRAAALCLVCLPLAGCGGSTSEFTAGPVGMVGAPSSIADHGAADARSGRLVVRMGEDYFRPTIIRAPAGSRLTLTVENVGEVAHSFDVATSTQKVDVIVQPGDRTTVHVRVPELGRLLFFCKFHWTRGMAGYIEPSG